MSSTTTYTNYALLPSEGNYTVSAIEQVIPRSHSRISWGAVLAGTAVALAVSVLLSILGLAFGVGVFLGPRPGALPGGR